MDNALLYPATLKMTVDGMQRRFNTPKEAASPAPFAAEMHWDRNLVLDFCPRPAHIPAHDHLFFLEYNWITHVANTQY